MKKLVLAVVIVLGSLSFNSCTDGLEELETRNETQPNELHASDPDDDGTADPNPQEGGNNSIDNG